MITVNLFFDFTFDSALSLPHSMMAEDHFPRFIFQWSEGGI